MCVSRRRSLAESRDDVDEKTECSEERCRLSGCSIGEGGLVEEILGAESTAHVTVAVHRATVETTGTLANGRLLDVVHEETQLSDVGSHRNRRAIGDLPEGAHVVVVGILAPFGLLVDRPVRFEVHAILDQRTAVAANLIHETFFVALPVEPYFLHVADWHGCGRRGNTNGRADQRIERGHTPVLNGVRFGNTGAVPSRTPGVALQLSVEGDQCGGVLRARITAVQPFVDAVRVGLAGVAEGEQLLFGVELGLHQIFVVFARTGRTFGRLPDLARATDRDQRENNESNSRQHDRTGRRRVVIMVSSSLDYVTTMNELSKRVDRRGANSLKRLSIVACLPDVYASRCLRVSRTRTNLFLWPCFFLYRKQTVEARTPPNWSPPGE